METLGSTGKLFEQEGKQLKATKEVPETDQLLSAPPCQSKQ